MNNLRVYRQRKSRRSLSFLKGLLSLAVIVGAAFCLAYAWQQTEDAVVEDLAADAAYTIAEPESSEPPPVPDTSAAEPSSEASAPDAEAEADTADPLAAEPADPDGAVPKKPVVPVSYFNDALFVGDSISTGIPLYHVADNAAVVAASGITPENINHYACIDTGEDEKITVLEAAREYGERGKVYIMLGGNGLNLDKETFVEGYSIFVDAVKEQYPEALIYLQSMTPVVKDYENELNPNLNNETIDEFNLEILALAKRKGVYYLDVASAFKDEDGNLPEEASPVDGLHFTPEYYAKWFEYLRTHAITTEGTT